MATDYCDIWHPNFGEKLYYSGILVVVGFLFSRALHEIGHIVVTVLTGGEVPSEFHVQMFLYVIPMGIMNFPPTLPVLLAGPLTGVLVGWYVGLTNNLNSLGGPCGGRNKWKRRRGLVTGFLIQALWDAIYLVPVVDPMPFNSRPDGDGVAIAMKFREMGLHTNEVFGVTNVVNPAYLIAGLALVGTFYVAWKVYSCSPLFCNACSI